MSDTQNALAEMIASTALRLKDKIHVIADEMDRIDIRDLKVSFNQLRVWMGTLDHVEDHLGAIQEMAEQVICDRPGRPVPDA